MLAQIMELVQQQAGSAIVQNPAVPNDKNDATTMVAGESLQNGLQQLLSGGGVKQIMDLFSGKTPVSNDNPAVQQISGNVVSDLMNKVGLSGDQAGNVASSLVPNALQDLIQKVKDPNNSQFQIQDIFNQLSGGATQGLNLQGLLQKFQNGLDQDGDGDTDFQDLIAAFSSKSNNTNSTNSSSGGGLMDSLKGLFGN